MVQIGSESSIVIQYWKEIGNKCQSTLSLVSTSREVMDIVIIKCECKGQADMAFYYVYTKGELEFFIAYTRTKYSR